MQPNRLIRGESARPRRPSLMSFLMAVFAPLAVTGALAAAEVPKFSVYEETFQHAGQYENPYTELTATAELTEPDGKTIRRAPLFWDGDRAWKFRFAPDKTGQWTWRVESRDHALNGRSGSFRVVPSDRHGGIQPMKGFPRHFQRQDGSPFWFMGDTAWALYTDSEAEHHDRQAAQKYIDTRAGQGFNVVHSMLLSEAGWGNQGGPPLDDVRAEKINPGYWKEVDRRVAYLNGRGVVGGLVLGWGDKRRTEPFAWGRFPGVEARRRYARYIAARYSAMNVFFLVAGEWHAEIRATPGATEDSTRKAFIAIGDELRRSDPHGRMIAIHPMTREGTVREFVGSSWMSFGDYQQNYHDLHRRILLSRRSNLPVVNGEYGYFLRDCDGDGLCDKPNSFDVDAIRHATWDIAMAGGYFVTGFGTTYFGGNRDPGPFDVDARKNDPWEEQIQNVPKLFTSLEWWKLSPEDEAITAPAPRGEDRTWRARRGGKSVSVPAPPSVAYWLLAEPGRTYVAYVRGVHGLVEVRLEGKSSGAYHARQYNPRTAEFQELTRGELGPRFQYRPPDSSDWVVLLQRAG